MAALRKESLKDAELAFLLAAHAQSLAVLVLAQDSKGLLPLVAKMNHTLKQYARGPKSTPNRQLQRTRYSGLRPLARAADLESLRLYEKSLARSALHQRRYERGSL